MNWRTLGMTVAVLLVLVGVPLWLAFHSSPTPDYTAEAQRIANEFDRLIRMRQQQVFAIAAFPSIRAFAASDAESRSQRAAVALNELQAWVAADQRIREAFVVDPSGNVSLTTAAGWNTFLGARSFVRAALAGQIGVSAVSRDRGEYSVYYAAPVLNNKGEIAGALVARVAAQELWDVMPRGDAWYGALIDENGVRLDDSGEPARRLMALAPLDAVRAVQIVNEATYGAEMPTVRATNQVAAQARVTQGEFTQLSPYEMDASALAVKRLETKPWTVAVVAPTPAPASVASRWMLPVIAALVLALGGAVLMRAWVQRTVVPRAAQ